MDFHYAGRTTVVAGHQHPTVSKYTRYKLRIVAKGNFGPPSLGWDQPFSLKTISAPPPGAITDDTIRSDYWLKPGIPMLFNK
jgi:hypothetical protein